MSRGRRPSGHTRPRAGHGGNQRRAAGRARLSLSLWVLLAVLCVVGGRLVWMQVVAAPAYAAQAAAQRRGDIELKPRRGSIYDREGEPLAVSFAAKDVYATPKLVKEPEKVAASLASVLGDTPESYLPKLTRDSGFVYVARKVDADRARALQDMELPGIGFLDDSRRAYPSGELACQILGFVGFDDEGLAGVEKEYDEILAGVSGRLIAERDPSGLPIPGGVSTSEDPVDGRDIWLTIDKDIQYEAQLGLAAAVETWGAKGGSIIVMDPRSGEVYAMASTPTFDPNDFRSAQPAALRNRAACDAYEPGSTIKAMTAAAVVDRGLYRASSMFSLPPTLRVGGRTIHESHPRGSVKWSLTQIVTKSSNVGAVRLGQALGEKGLYDYFARFGLTEKTGIDFPGEAKGWLPPTSQWSASSIGNIPFGQGISVTPLQLARALAAIANGGELPTPHFLMQAKGEERPTWPLRRAIGADASREMIDMLRQVVTDGTGEEAEVPGYDVAGKTGTAQKARTDGRGYAAGKYVASFAGFLPAEDPRVLIVVTVDEPSRAIYGGSVAAPTFSRIAQFTVSHLKIPPAVRSGAATEGSTPDDGADDERVLESGDSSR